MPNTYTILVMDYQSGRAFTISITKNIDDDFEEYIDAKLTKIGFRLQDCNWMEFTNQEVEDLTHE